MKYIVSMMLTGVMLASILVVASNDASAQSPTPNIALSATVTHNGGGTGTRGPQNYNDGLWNPMPQPVGCPQTGPDPWGWTSTGTGQNGTNNWIQFDWPSPVTFGEMTFYHTYTCRRQLGAGDIQTWDGANWVTVHSFAFLQPWDIDIRVIQFPPVTTSRMRITNMLIVGIAGQQLSNPAFREIEIRNVCTDPPTDVSFQAPAFITLPDDIAIDYSVGRSVGEFDATITFNFHTPTGLLVHSESTVVPINANTVNGTYVVQSSNLTPGFYNLEVVFNVFDICNAYEDVILSQVIMVLAPGQTLCEVWPGDVNNDGVVNYGDRASLNTYIHDANLRSDWLQGPARYRTDAGQDPLTYIRWELQPGVPWNTPEGCYMDSDGNGVINNFDYIAIKLNWLRTQGAVPTKHNAAFNSLAFDMDQNYPNPFNPATSIRYSAPERSQVVLTVSDMLGRTVATLVEGSVEAGVHTASFDASGLTSGNYIATISMTGTESGLRFAKTIKMVLGK
jgi:hypothetical protein